jgi:hypothetical protein
MVSREKGLLALGVAWTRAERLFMKARLLGRGEVWSKEGRGVAVLAWETKVEGGGWDSGAELGYGERLPRTHNWKAAGNSGGRELSRV